MIFGYGWCHPFLSIIRRDNNIYEYYFLLKPAKKKASVNCVFFVEWSFVPYLILCTEKVKDVLKVFWYSFSEAIPIVILSLCDRHKIITNDWL